MLEKSSLAAALLFLAPLANLIFKNSLLPTLASPILPISGSTNDTQADYTLKVKRAYPVQFGGLRKPDCDSQTSQKTSTIHDIEDHLFKFLKRLKMFTTCTGFDDKSFESQSTSLAQHMAMTKDLIASRYPEHLGLKNQFEFCKRVFDVMRHAVEELKFFNVKSMEHDLVRRMIHLNISLLGLHDNHGKPDSSIPGFVSKVARFYNTLKRLQSRFSALKTVQSTVQFVFENKSVQAARTLEVLQYEILKQRAKYDRKEARGSESG